MQQPSRRTSRSLSDLPSPGKRPSAYADAERAPDGRRPVSQPVLRTQPTAETVDALRSVLDEHFSTVIDESAADRYVQEAPDVQEAPADEEESMNSQVVMLFEQLQAAEARAAYAEQQAIYAGQQAAQQLAMQAVSAPQSARVHDEPNVSSRRSSFATWGGWCVAVLAVALAAGTYFTSYRPLREELAGQTKLLELQARRSSETEAALRHSFDSERETLNDQLNALRVAAASAAAASSAATAADLPPTQQSAANGGERAAATKAAKLDARAAKREAWLAKKAEFAAKREARADKHKAHTAASADGDKSDKSPAPTSKHTAKPAADDKDDDSSSNDPLEGL